MPAKDFALLARYWKHEPWGAWRDNVHSAIIARELRRTFLHQLHPHKKLPTIQIDEFMVMDPDERAEIELDKRRKMNRSIADALKAMAGGKRTRAPKRKRRTT